MPWSRVLSFTDPYSCQVAVQALSWSFIRPREGTFMLI
jgi:hypothetical protein